MSLAGNFLKGHVYRRDIQIYATNKIDPDREVSIADQNEPKKAK